MVLPDKNNLGVLLVFLLALNINNLTVRGDPVDSARIIFYYGPTFEDNQVYELDNLASVLEHPKFVNRDTSCYLHGYSNTQEDYSTHLMVNSYLKGDTFNLLFVDFGGLVNGSYISAQRNVLKLAPRVAKSILDLVGAGLDVNSISLVGHSMGGVAVGMIGREIYQQSNGSVLLPRITSLDPSNPDIHDEFILPLIEKTDARFVDVIHTSAGETATGKHLGHADFWPNGGTPVQPGCPTGGVNKKCSHHKAYAYWAQSVAGDNSNQLLSFRAKNYETFLRRKNPMKCGGGIPMGIYCPPSACGDYYLKLDSTYGETGDPEGLQK